MQRSTKELEGRFPLSVPFEVRFIVSSKNTVKAGYTDMVPSKHTLLELLRMRATRPIAIRNRSPQNVDHYFR